nr:MAG TPA: NEMP family [Caudoviricetes sp.]
MIISDEEYLKFIENGQKYALEILREYFKNDDEEVRDDTKI